MMQMKKKEVWMNWKSGLKHNMACSLQTICTTDLRKYCFLTEFVVIKCKGQIRYGIKERTEWKWQNKI